MTSNALIEERMRRIDTTGLLGIALMGSYARQEAGKYSDIDLVCFGKKGEVKVDLVHSKLIVQSYVDAQAPSTWFEQPELATEFMYGLQSMQVLQEKDGYLSRLREQARAFRWSPQLQLKADAYASKEIAALLEEVSKGLQGILANDRGRQLNSIFGMSHGLFKVVRVQKGIFLRSDNTQYSQILHYFADRPEITENARIVFGEYPATLEDRTRQGLRLFLDIVRELGPALDKKTRMMVNHLRGEIQQFVS